ncbi:hypothetical protein WA026_011876 [Henosepilachna vigintioctopunctata]|uniref:DUF155 domain-containing protein n=1 Tax=Henosepilachna vigintioctopunctata TaxID=420089 RepID=A0AAW1ULJ0_9CUCU
MTRIFFSSIKCVNFLKLNYRNFNFCNQYVKTAFKISNFSTTQTNFKSKGIQDNISSLQLKKRPAKKKKIIDEEVKTPGLYNVAAFATAEEYNLEDLIQGLQHQDLYEVKFVENSTDVVVASAKYQVNKEPREIFFFREGGLVLWNIDNIETGNLLSFLKVYESDSYSNQLLQEESEVMTYKHQDNGKQSLLEKDGNFLLNICQDAVILDKYTFSNALVLSVKLGVWEASLEKYIDSIEFVTEDLKRGNKIKMTREEVLQKHGELFGLRHLINLSSDLLDTPDFYWENDQLENLYVQICTYLSINKRTKVMNEKINHCVELIELLSSHLSDKHHTRLEWMVILLILTEVIFEVIHYIDRFVAV